MIVQGGLFIEPVSRACVCGYLAYDLSRAEVGVLPRLAVLYEILWSTAAILIDAYKCATQDYRVSSVDLGGVGDGEVHFVSVFNTVEEDDVGGTVLGSLNVEGE